ncbi:hypothetical protein D9611_001900 [Ephemerocybe angulata]|uniref:Peptidase M48 domain-containing protein n=1 Tax=Ephemerocybe angulata TaxID=980116 RepID=A0A8H5CIE8_9AGAR|nr:hypothetical protein D9611_001900 [Tulosesus angulatus]
MMASTAFELARTTSRIALTFLPVLLFKRARSKRIVQHAHIHGIPLSEEKREKHMKKMQHTTRALQFLGVIPFILFWATIIASLEKTPLTGRWRTILLSPEEEDEIAAQLAGQGWFNAVGEILAAEGAPQIVPPNDWRYQWIQETLDKLVNIIPVLADERRQAANWLGQEADGPPLPPPAKFPLRPRPRAAEYLHFMCAMICGEKPSLPPRAVAPSSFSLLLVDNPCASNAFSYGFGPDGGSGIVVYSGFLEDIFRKMPIEYHTPPDDRSWVSKFFGLSSPPPPRPSPTKEQTAELAILLAHELAHLILWHHLETLSSVTVVVPGTLSIISDLLRVMVFPVTMFFGPFINDAVAQLGKVGSGELSRMGEYCTTAKQEVEADVVSARILAHAGYDARDAIRFWERRNEDDLECHRHGTRPDAIQQIARNIVGTGHPVNELRVEGLRKELDRWEAERQKAAAKLQAKKSKDSSS